MVIATDALPGGALARKHWSVTFAILKEDYHTQNQSEKSANKDSIDEQVSRMFPSRSPNAVKYQFLCGYLGGRSNVDWKTDFD